MAEVLEIFLVDKSDPISVGYVLGSNHSGLVNLLNSIAQSLSADFSKLPLLIQSPNLTVRKVSLARLEGKITSPNPEIHCRIIKV